MTAPPDQVIVILRHELKETRRRELKTLIEHRRRTLWTRQLTQSRFSERVQIHFFRLFAVSIYFDKIDVRVHTDTGRRLRESRALAKYRHQCPFAMVRPCSLQSIRTAQRQQPAQMRLPPGSRVNRKCVFRLEIHDNGNLSTKYVP